MTDTLDAIAREKFEHWYSNEGAYPKAIERNGGDGYLLMGANLSWIAWKQAWSALSNQGEGEHPAAADNAKAADCAALAMIGMGFAWSGEEWRIPPRVSEPDHFVFHPAFVDWDDVRSMTNGGATVTIQSKLPIPAEADRRDAEANARAVAAVRNQCEEWNDEAKSEGFGGGNTRAKIILEIIDAAIAATQEQT